MTDFRPALAALAGVLLLAGCSDNAVRSPDLPPPVLTDIGRVLCEDTTLAAGQTTQCRVLECTYDVITEDGNAVPTPAACPPLTFESSIPTVASVTADGQVTGVGVGTSVITAVADGVRSPGVDVAVDAACIESFAVLPAGVTIIAGTTQEYRANVVFSSGDEQVVTAETTFTVTNPDADPDAVALDGARAVSNPDIGATTSVVISGTYSGPALACDGVSLTNATALTVIPAEIMMGGVCIEAVPPADAFAPGAPVCRTDRGACATDPLVFGLADNTTRQLQVRARYNNGLECDGTDLATFSSNPGGIVAIDNNTAIATAVSEGTTTLSATIGSSTGTRGAQVRVDQVLGNNSLAVSARELINNQPFTFGNAQRFACVGANDLVAGLGGDTLRGQLLTYARTRTCGDNERNEDGLCTALVFDGDGNAVVDPDSGEQLRSVEAFNALQLQNDETNPMPAPGETVDSTVWTAQAGFWNGEECEISGSGGSTPNSTALVGDAFIDPRRLQLTSGNLPVDDAALQPNGLVFADGAVRLGFSCVTATITNPLDASNVVTDGMTVLVLPLTNDGLLGASDDADRLCATLLPAFSNPILGALKDTPLDPLGRIQLINTLSAITEIVNPALESLDVLPLDVVLTTLLEGDGTIPGLTDLTQLIVQPLDQGLISPVLEPLVCQVTNGLNLLLGLLSGGSGNQECPSLVP